MRHRGAHARLHPALPSHRVPCGRCFLRMSCLTALAAGTSRRRDVLIAAVEALRSVAGIPTRM